MGPTQSRDNRSCACQSGLVRHGVRHGVPKPHVHAGDRDKWYEMGIHFVTECMQPEQEMETTAGDADPHKRQVFSTSAPSSL